MAEATVTMDLHGMTCYQARTAIDAALRRAGRDTCRLRLVHGYHGGSALRDMIRREYPKHPKVKRVFLDLNPGVTELVLREYGSEERGKRS